MFMWFIKSELRKQIDKYDKDKDILLEFARSSQKLRIEDITLEDIKGFYTDVVAPKNSLWQRNQYMLSVRKFFKYYRGENVLKWQSVTDNPLKSVEQTVIMPLMQKIEKKKVGRPPNVKMIEKVYLLREVSELSFRKIALAIDEDVRQVHLWWTAAQKMIKEGTLKLSTGKEVALK